MRRTSVARDGTKPVQSRRVFSNPQNESVSVLSRLLPRELSSARAEIGH